MTDTKNHEPSDGAVTPLSEDVGTLVRLAGPRPTMAEATVERMQAELRPLWEAEVKAQEDSAEQADLSDHADRRFTSRPAFRLLAAAALVAVAIAAGLLTRSTLTPIGEPFANVALLDGAVTAWPEGDPEEASLLAGGDALSAGQAVATSESARAALATTSGHSLRLDRDTRVVLLSKTELRLEQGAVYISSGWGPGNEGAGPGGDARGVGQERAGGSGPAWSVQTAMGRVTEIGTQFEVRLSADTLTIRVREGEILLAPDGDGSASALDAGDGTADTVGGIPGAKGLRGIRGIAGEELTLTAGEVHRRQIDAHGSLFDWTQGIAPVVEIDGEPLDRFLEWAAREGGLSLSYSDESIETEAASILLSGEIEGLRPVASLEVVLPAVGLTHEIDAGTLRIHRYEPEPAR